MGVETFQRYRARLIGIRGSGTNLRNEALLEGEVYAVLVLRDDSLGKVHEVTVSCSPLQAEVLSHIFSTLCEQLEGIDERLIEAMNQDVLDMLLKDGEDNVVELGPFGPSDDDDDDE